MTIPERTNYDRTSTFAEVVAVVDALGQSSDLIHRETLLLTKDGKDVPLLVLARPPIVTPAQARASGKPVTYIQGNIHGGEVEGKEASLIAMRDILFGDKQHLLNDQILVFAPIYNADGNDNMSSTSRPSQEMSPLLAGERLAHGYDLNRDGMAVETPETRALYLNVIQRWDPALLVDLHTTNGTWHGYSLTYAPSYHTAGDGATSAYTADVMLPAIAASVKEKFDLNFGWYGSFDYRDWPPTELRTYHHAPRYLTNNMGLRNRMAILAETFAHDRFYKRVHAANVFVEEILEYTNLHGREIQRINAAADARTVSRSSQSTAAIENGIQAVKPQQHKGHYLDKGLEAYRQHQAGLVFGGIDMAGTEQQGKDRHQCRHHQGGIHPVLGGILEHIIKRQGDGFQLQGDIGEHTDDRHQGDQHRQPAGLAVTGSKEIGDGGNMMLLGHRHHLVDQGTAQQYRENRA